MLARFNVAVRWLTVLKLCWAGGLVAGSMDNGTIKRRRGRDALKQAPAGHCSVGHSGLSAVCFPGLVELRHTTAAFQSIPGQLDLWVHCTTV
jgi:hypothetical protein